MAALLTAVRHQPAPLMRLSWHHFVVIVAVAMALAAILGIALAPDLADRYARRAVKQFEREFGFETGIITITDSTGTYPRWGITAVAPGGRFDRLGFRVGDVPFDYHGRTGTLLYGALRDASEGKPAEIDVYNAREAAAGDYMRRRIVITAIR